MIYKKFSERFNLELDEIGVSSHRLERIEATAKLFKIPKFKAEALIYGNILPNEELLQFIANEFEVHNKWLLGEMDSKN